MTNQLEGNFSYLKYEQTPNKHNVYLLRSAVSIAVPIYFIFTSCTTCSLFFLQGPSSVAELIFYAQGLDQSRRTRGLSFGWSHRLIVGLCRQLTGRTVRLSLLLDVYFTADLLVGLPGARFFANQLVGLFIASSSRWGSPAKLGTPQRLNYLSLYQLRWGLTSCTGDSSALGFFMDFVTSHRCAIKLLHAIRIRGTDLGQHIWSFDTYLTDDVGKSSRLFFDPATRFILHLLVGWGTKWLHFIWR
jgi:hypothetical protein